MPFKAYGDQLSGMYELWQFQADKGLAAKDVSVALSGFEPPTSSVLCGAFTSLFGPDETLVCIWRHGSFDDAEALREKWREFSAGEQLLFSSLIGGRWDSNLGSRSFKINFAPLFFYPNLATIRSILQAG